MWWIAASVVGILATSVVALPCWNAGLRDSVGRVLTVEQIHLIEYAGFGGITTLAGRRRASLRRKTGLLLVIVAGVGVADELLQTFLPNRAFQWTDVWWNWAGGVLGITCARVIAWGIHRWRSATSSTS